MSHVLGFEDVIQLGFGEQIFLEQNEFVNAPICDEGFLGYGGTLFVAEHRVEGGNEADRILDLGEAAFAVGFNAGDAARVKYDRSAAQQRETKNKLKAMIGSAMFSSSSLASQAMEIAMSAPMIWKQTWLTTSGISGFTLPGMMEEPGCVGGRWSSYSPQRGPDESQRRSLQILDSCTAAVFITPLINANSPESCVASTRSPASLLCS
jgi:hypothetical protein